MLDYCKIQNEWSELIETLSMLSDYKKKLAVV